jgi:hypothetical protein
MNLAVRQGRDDLKDDLIDAVATYVADKLGNVEPRRWKSAALSPAEVSDLFEQSDQWLHNLVEKPLDSVGADLGPAPPVAAAGGAVAANLLLATVDRKVQMGRLIVDVLGIGAGTLTGMPHMVVACSHDLAGIAFHEAVDRGLNSALHGLLDAKRDAPDAPQRLDPTDLDIDVTVTDDQGPARIVETILGTEQQQPPPVDPPGPAGSLSPW